MFLRLHRSGRIIRSIGNQYTYKPSIQAIQSFSTKKNGNNESFEDHHEEDDVKPGVPPNAPQADLYNQPKKSSGLFGSFLDNVKGAYNDLFGVNQPTTLRRQVGPPEGYVHQKPTEEETDEEKVAYEGPTSIVMVQEQLNPWEAMRQRLQNSPLIREIMKGTKKIGEVAGNTGSSVVCRCGFNVNDTVEDVREVWETSQNPVIYTLSGVWENLTSESEEALTLLAIRKLDKTFVKETWAEEVRVNLAQPLIEAHLRGNLRAWKDWLGEAVYEKLAAEIRARKADGISFDPHVLDIHDNQIIMKLLEGGNPVVVIVYMVQQINCIRNREGEIIQVS